MFQSLPKFEQVQMNRQRHIKALDFVDSDKNICFMFSLYLANVNIVTPG